ncbi:hypothetical protein [Prevotella jejuni]|uniref:hypothetical protein n=1 Tax=Prevotella jejuni TaxID=1177574 RepID=UPI001BAD039C|nr:hypothetical protein [Prevotella jejuni]QUB78125.1 hypothetical protein J4857_00425 [Prevotella jejuni]
MEKMKQNENYSAPKCEIVYVNETTNLMDASMPGQHKKANHATGPAAAKANQWNEEDFEDEAPASWED